MTPRPGASWRTSTPAACVRAAALLACANCSVAPLDHDSSATPIGPRPATAHLQLDNPQRLLLQIDAVVGDGCLPVAQPGSAAAITLDVVPGAYVVRATTPAGEIAMPAPLVDAALAADRTVRVTVVAPAAPSTTDPDFAFVPAGPALIGDALGIGQEDERPARIVPVSAFCIGRREVTNAEYAAFLDAVAAAVDPSWCAFDSRKCRLVRGDDSHWSTPTPHLPVVTVSLAGANAYCDWCTRVTGIRHRLPTEIEWEKAARGPESFTFGYGNVYRRAAANQESGALGEVALYPPNGYGLCDMTGNAFEWTADAYPARDQAGVVVPAADAAAAAGSQFQVLRGGSFVLDGMYLRNSFRMRQRPDVRADDIGFRVVREPSALAEAR